MICFVFFHNCRAEALHYTGDDSEAFYTSVKNKVLRETESYRAQIRRSLSKESLQEFFDNEKQASLGIVSGALIATLL
jgi:hypothetical protein